MLANADEDLDVNEFREISNSRKAERFSNAFTRGAVDESPIKFVEKFSFRNK
jgi:hypothetical protein